MGWLLVVTFFANGFSHIETQRLDTIKECTELRALILKNAPDDFGYEATCMPIPKWSEGSTTSLDKLGSMDQ